MPTKQELEASKQELERGLQEALSFNKMILNKDNEDIRKKYVSLIKMTTALFFFYMTLIMSACFYLRMKGL